MSATIDAATLPASGRAPRPDMAWMPSGSYRMGSDHHYPEEAASHSVKADGIWMDAVHRGG